jgi:hypothetical protein
MIDAQSFRDRTPKHFPSEAMRTNVYAFLRFPIPENEATVSITIASRRPNPAVARIFDFDPEPSLVTHAKHSSGTPVDGMLLYRVFPFEVQYMSEPKLIKSVDRYGWTHHFFAETVVYRTAKNPPSTADSTPQTETYLVNGKIMTFDEFTDDMIEQWADERRKRGFL